MPRVRTLLITLALGALSAAPGGAAPVDSSGTLYSLNVPTSAYQVGCQVPCDCPVLERPTYGSFTLVPGGSDPLYRYYDVVGYIASFNNGPGAVAITGSGRYQVGGEVALVNRMTLDVSIEGGPIRHFDSGLVPIQTPFPSIDVSCAAHGFYCYDSVLVVDAAPIKTAGVPPPPTMAAGVETVRPNPFARTTSVTFALDRPGPAELAVLDLAGRRVRELAARQEMSVGRRTVAWDGRDDDGRALPAGVYWVRLTWPGGDDRHRIVKLD